MSSGIPMLEENAKIIANRFPAVLERILKSGNRPSDNFFYEEHNGEHTLMMQRGEHAFPVYGTRNKSKLIKRWFDGLKLERESLYAVTGFGDGSILNTSWRTLQLGFLPRHREGYLHPSWYPFTDWLFLRFFPWKVWFWHRWTWWWVLCRCSKRRPYRNFWSEYSSLLPLHSVDEGYYDKMLMNCWGNICCTTSDGGECQNIHSIYSKILSLILSIWQLRRMWEN